MPRVIGTDVVLESNEGYDVYLHERQRVTEALIDKWQWLLEGTKKQQLPPIDMKHWGTMAILFENQMVAAKRDKALMEATVKTDVALPVTYSLPIIRKVYPNLVAMKVASVQPMPFSSGGVMNIFYQDFLAEDNANQPLDCPDSDYAQNIENAVPKRIKMQITKAAVTADKKILGASWSQEVEEDARGALNIDIEGELVQQMAMQIQREIDQIVLAEMLLWASAGNVNWAWTVPAAYTSAKDYYQTLGHACVDAEMNIYAQFYRQADWIICGRRVASYMRKMQDFVPAPRNQPPDPFKMSVQHIGEITGFWDVYLTMHINQDRAIMGCYPRSMTDTAYVFAPYIPLTAMPKVYAEYLGPNDATLPGAYINTDKWSRNVRTRYAKRLVMPRLLSTLSIAA